MSEFKLMLQSNTNFRTENLHAFQSSLQQVMRNDMIYLGFHQITFPGRISVVVEPCFRFID